VDRKVVHHDDIVELQRGNEHLLDIGDEQQRWSPILGQVVKLGSPFEGRTHVGQAEALLG